MFHFARNYAYFLGGFIRMLMTSLYNFLVRIDVKHAMALVVMVGGLLISTTVSAQDVHFTQFDFNPLFINPANTGNFNGNWRVAGTYRNQWAGAANPFNTASASVDLPLYVLGRRIGVGFQLLGDDAGLTGPTTTKAYGSIGYGTNYNKNYVNVGLQVGFANASFEHKWGLWNRQTGEFDNPNNEVNPQNSSYLDVNLGAIWKRNIHIFEPEVGVSLMHVNSPSRTFYSDDKDRLPIRFTLHTTFKTKLSDEIHVIPKVYLTGLKGATIAVLGSEVDYYLLGNKSSLKRFFGGVYLRSGVFSNIDAVMGQIGATYGRLDVALSYDLGMSNLSQSKTMSSFEISFIYKSISTVLNSYSIPCERY